MLFPNLSPSESDSLSESAEGLFLLAAPRTGAPCSELKVLYVVTTTSYLCSLSASRWQSRLAYRLAEDCVFHPHLLRWGP
jgi:hypothetical protein